MQCIYNPYRVARSEVLQTLFYSFKIAKYHTKTLQPTVHGVTIVKNTFTLVLQLQIARLPKNSIHQQKILLLSC